MAETNEIMAVQENALAAFSAVEGNVGKRYCSITPTGDRKKDSRIFSAINNPEYRIADYINKQLSITDVLVEIRELLNEETGTIEVAPRVVLIDSEGHSYQATSKGILNAVQSAFIVYGNAPWDPALEIVIKQRPVKSGSMLTFDVVG